MSRIDRPILDKRKIKSQSAMRNSLLELLRNQPLAQIAINDITSHAKVGKATFYRHYATKDELLADLAVDEIRDLLSFAAPLVTRVGNLESARALCAFIDSRRPLWSALLTGGAIHQVRAEYIRQSRELIPTRMRAHGNALTVEAATIYSSAGTFELLSWWLSSAPAATAREVAAILSELVMVPDLA